MDWSKERLPVSFWRFAFMECGLLAETMDYPGWSRILAGARQLPVKWRPGGGFYTDERPLDALRKAHIMGRTAAAIPVGDTDIQQEHENFLYQKLKKSETIFVAETAMAMGAGCTGRPQPDGHLARSFRRILAVL